jgi:tRNA dimethylallyltransferase
MSDAPVRAALVITGPTASGKGALALELARRLGGEIISMDSMKVYREMEVATAKPSPARLREIPHHLLDFVDPAVDFSTGEFLRHLDETIEDIRRRDRQVILSGGTALYLKGFLEGFQGGPPADWELRARLLAEAEQSGAARLHRRLGDLDPGAAGRIHPADLRRVVRALEVVMKTGRPSSEDRDWGKRTVARPYPVRVFGIAWERERLYERINRRVERMVGEGLFDEARRLARREPPLSRSASQSIGYKEVLEGAASGLSESEMTAHIQQTTRRFAKRQLTWFRKLAIEWIPAGEDPAPARWAEEVIRRLTP